MSKHLVVDAWIREAQEAAKLVEDIETRVKMKNKSLEQEQQHNLISDDIARAKLVEVGVKLDRLESLLHNPPSKPILANEDLEYRWEMLSDIQLRTKSLALCLYAVPSPSRNGSGGSHLSDPKQTNRNAASYADDQINALFAKTEPDLLKPLVSDDATQSHMQIKHFGSLISMDLFWKVFQIICAILGAVAFLFILIIICAAI